MDEKNIIKTYKYFFKNRDDPKQSLIGFGFECEKGWFPLIERTLKRLSLLREQLPEHFEIVQIKEKFGGLRIYTTCGIESAWDIIREAEIKSYNICEVCGEKGELREELIHIRTLCNKHFEEKCRRRNNGFFSKKQ